MGVENKIATVFGGTGFVGRQIVRELAARGVRVKVATRVPESAYFLKPAGNVGQIVPLACRYSDPESIAEAVNGSDFVVNCIGVLYERGKRQTFARAHVEIPSNIAAACAQHNVKSFVHISALGIEASTSKYAQSKLEGEKSVRQNFPKAVILRPSVIFGEDDAFFNMFAELSRYSPVLPLIGGGKTKFQPVYVGDVASAVIKALEYPGANGFTFELGGPEVLSFKEIYARLFSYTHRKRMLVNLPFGVAKIEASFLSLLPKPLLTPDQVESLKSDSIVAAGALSLESLGVNATGLDSVLPSYLPSYRKGGRFAEIKIGAKKA